jgi:ABC-type polysaccharide/polyol phosphate transport system ATPase subunit
VSDQAAIVVERVSKRYRLYHERNQSLKATVLRGRRARYDEFLALDDVSFEVPSGTTFGFIGENGSGKSTMLKCMARILRPDGGRIDVRGKVSALLELGAGFHPELSGRENVYLNGAILGLSRKQLDQRFDEIVGFAGIEPFIDSPVKNYSSGMYVRLGFAIAINVDPDILMIDEVLAVGDAEFQRRCTEKITEFREEGRTIVVVSHSLPSVQSLCSEVALLDHGHLVRVGPASEVIEEYLAEVSDRQARLGDTGHRGSGQVRIERVEMLNPEGVPRTVIRTGAPAAFRIHYEALSPVDDPVFSLAFHTVDGVYVSNPNTRQWGVVAQLEPGSGVLDYVVEHLPLTSGHYDVGITVYDRTMTRQLDLVDRVLRFTVIPVSPKDEGGVVSFGGDWRGTALTRRANRT